ncbi:MAG: ArsR family transcriptional regulator [Candidatus Thermoplasmatota archaeon]
MKEDMIEQGIKSTKKTIMEELLGRDLTALDLAEIVGINESAVRRHLSKLESDGFVRTYFEKASKGRPKKYFALTDEGKKVFPKQNELLLNLVIKHLRKTVDEEVLEEISDKIVDDLKEFFLEVDDVSLEKKVEKVVKNSDELGFYCSYTKDDGSYTLTYENCAFGELPKKQSSWLCSIHRKVLDDILGEADIQQKKSMKEGDKICLQKIENR